MKRTMYAMSSSAHFFLIYDSAETFVEGIEFMVKKIDGLIADDSILPRFPNPSIGRAEFLSNIHAIAKDDCSYEGRCIAMGLNRLGGDSYYSKKTSLGWVGVYGYNLEPFTSKSYDKGKYGVSIGIQSCRTNTLEAVRSWIAQSRPSFATRPAAYYFGSLWNGFLLDQFDVSIERYLGFDTLIRKSELSCSIDGLEFPGVRFVDLGEFVEISFELPLEINRPDRQLYERVCDHLGLLSIFRITE